MEKQSFTVTIDASPAKVWDVLWGEKTYPEWTKPFNADSRIETNWEVGSRVLFLDGNGEGMVSEIAEKVPNKFMSFKHLGEIMKGVETLHPEWGEAFENYTLTQEGDKTVLVAEAPIPPDHMEFMTTAFPKSLQLVKEIAEKQ